LFIFIFKKTKEYFILNKV